METKRYLGGDIGGTNTKFAVVDGDNQSMAGLWQRSTRLITDPYHFTNSQIDLAGEFLREQGVQWKEVQAICFALPGTFTSREVWGESPNFPKELWNTNMVEAFSVALERNGLPQLPIMLMNDANAGGLAEAIQVQRLHGPGSVLGIFPGTGLGGSYTNAQGQLQEGDHLAGAEFGHLQLSILSGVRPLPCGCGRPACIEPWVSLSGMDRWVPEVLARMPQDHPLVQSGYTPGQTKYEIRDLAAKWDAATNTPADPVARAVFSMQAKILGQAIGQLMITTDATHVVLGGGLVDPDATTEDFRTWFLSSVEQHARPLFWDCQQSVSFHVATLGDQSQAVGAAINAHQTLKTFQGV